MSHRVAQVNMAEDGGFGESDWLRGDRQESSLNNKVQTMKKLERKSKKYQQAQDQEAAADMIVDRELMKNRSFAAQQ